MQLFSITLKQWCCLIIFLLLGNFLCAQKIKGKVTDTLNNPIAYANVIVKDSLNVQIITYTTTDLEGKYQISLKSKGKYNLNISALSYQKTSETIIIANEMIIKNVVLNEQKTVLNEVIVHADRPIVVKKDTIIITVSSFLKGNETTVEDLLKNLPGFHVEADGTVKVGNQEIEKVMVEGDDFFKKGYSLLTKNLDADVVEKVEIYQKYSENKLLKDIEESGKVALNLKLKKDRKVDWFGNVSLAYGLSSKNTYHTRTNAMRLGEVAKHYLLTNLNNIGEASGGESAIYARSTDVNAVGAIGNNESAGNLIGLNPYQLSLKKSRYNFNNQELVSLNSIFKVSEKMKMTANGLFNWDEQVFVQQNIQSYTLSTLDFINTESGKIDKKFFSGSGNLQFDYDISKNELLEINAKYRSGNENTTNRLEFNSVPIHENLSNDDERFEYKTVYTNKFAVKKVLALSGIYIYEKKPQDFLVDTFLFSDLFPNVNATSMQQFSTHKMQFTGFEAHLLERKKNDDLLEVKMGFTNRIDVLKSSLNLYASDVINQPSDFFNDVKYTVGNLYANTKYNLKFGNYAFSAKLDVNQLFNRLESQGNTERQSPVFLSPFLGINYKINDNNALNLSYSKNFTNAKSIQVFDNYVLTSHRDFLKGGAGLSQVNSTNLNLGYNLGKWSNSFFASARISYIKNHDLFSTNALIDPNYTLRNTIRIDGAETLIANLTMDRYLKFISTNLKLNFNYFKSEFKNSVNDSELRLVKNTSFEYGFELRSAFDGIFNYNLGTKWNRSVIKTTDRFSNTNATSFIDFNFNFDNNFNVEIQSERYYFGSFDTKKSYYFLDLESKYKMQNTNITFTLSGKNLLNVRTFREVFISDISTSTTSYRLTPRFLLLGVDFRF